MKAAARDWTRWPSLAAFALLAASVACLGSTKLYGPLYGLSLVLALPLVARFDRGRLRPDGPQRLFLGAALGLVALAAVHLALGQASGRALEIYGRFLAGWLSATFLFAFLDCDARRLFRLLVALAAAHLGVATLVALWQTVDVGQGVAPDARAQGAINAVAFAELAAASGGIVSIAVAAWPAPGRPWAKAAGLIAAFALTVVVVTLSGTRGVMVALLLLPLLIALAVAQRVRARTIIVALGLCALLLGASLMLNARVGEAVSDAERLVSPGSAAMSVSVGDRLAMWQAAVELIARSPIVGHGFDAMRPERGLWPPPGAAYARLAVYNQVHNLYLDTMLRAGIVGLVLVLSLLAAPLYAGIRSAGDPRRKAAALCAIWIGACYAVFGLTQVVTAHATTTFQLAIYSAILLRCLVGDDGMDPSARDAANIQDQRTALKP